MWLRKLTPLSPPYPQSSAFAARLEGVYTEPASGTALIVQELVAGGSLRERLAAAPGGRLPEAEAAALARGVLDVLSELHAQGIAHGDVKVGGDSGLLCVVCCVLSAVCCSKWGIRALTHAA